MSVRISVESLSGCAWNPQSADSFLLWVHRQLEQLYQNADRADEYKAIIERLVANDRAGSHLQ